MILFKILYLSHSVESEIRKKYSNILIFKLTKFLEKLVFKYADISTTVSTIEKKKIMKLYNSKTILYPNALTLDNEIKKQTLFKDYIIYSGSYLYKPNKNAIDTLNKKIMPMLLEKFPNLKLVLTGGGFNKRLPWVINKGIVKTQINTPNRIKHIGKIKYPTKIPLPRLAYTYQNKVAGIFAQSINKLCTY